MMKTCLLVCSLCCLLLCSCMSRQLHSESGLYNVPLEHSYKVPVDGYWTWNRHNPYTHQASGSLYIAPLNVSAVQEDYPELAPLIVEQMDGLLKEKMTLALNEANKANNTNWVLTRDAAKADIRIELAVVSLRTQKPLLHILSGIIGPFTPAGVSHAVDFVSKGDITLEGAIRSARDGQLMFAFKDSNRAHLRFYHKDTYRRTGHVDANLRRWARMLARLCREGAYDRMGDHTLQERLEQRSFSDAVKSHLD